MKPNLCEGHLIACYSLFWFRNKLKIGDIVVTKYQKTFIIKRVAIISRNIYYLDSINGDFSLWVNKEDILVKLFHKFSYIIKGMAYSYQDTGLLPNTTYRYRIKAIIKK